MLFLESARETRPLKSSPDLNFYLVFKPYLLIIILALYLITDAIIARINRLKRINGSRHRLVPYYVEVSIISYERVSVNFSSPLDSLTS